MIVVNHLHWLEFLKAGITPEKGPGKPRPSNTETFNLKSPSQVISSKLNLFKINALAYRGTQGSISQVKLSEPWRNQFSNYAFGIII